MTTHLKYLATGALLIALGFAAFGLLLGYVWLFGEYYEATMLVTVAAVLITASYVIGRLVWEDIGEGR